MSHEQITITEFERFIILNILKSLIRVRNRDLYPIVAKILYKNECIEIGKN